MTLQNGLWTEGAVYLWSDSALWTPPPRPEIHAYAPKIAVSDDWPFAFVTCGTVGGVRGVAQAVLDAAPANFWELRRTVQEALAPFVGKSGERILIASYADQPRLTLIDSEEYLGHPPLTALELRPFLVCSGADRPQVMPMIEAGVSVETMPYIIRAQHADWDHDEGCLIAGKIGRVKVTRDGVEGADIDELHDPTMN